MQRNLGFNVFLTTVADLLVHIVGERGKESERKLRKSMYCNIENAPQDFLNKTVNPRNPHTGATYV